jgi:outer membrane protein OmpA-like peptidoglycan-associated protein
MKKFLLTLLITTVLSSALFSQKYDNLRPAAIGISFVLNDFKTPQYIRTYSLTATFRDNQLAKINEMYPGIALTYFKGLTNHIDFAGTLIGSFSTISLQDKANTSGDNFLLEGDASANFKLTTENYRVQPYASAGIGGAKYGSYYSAFMPFGVGLKINLFDEASIFITSQYRVPVTQETNNYHFVHSIGIAGNIGKKKVEPLKEVVIPQVEPPKDRDNDGIVDSLDACPDVAGPASLKGCPDKDGDGVADKDDKCPDVAGLARYDGCPIPDTDKDGINDEEDKCKDVPGVARYQGCPVPDSDHDGINDEEDKCPNLAGIAENQGCPAIAEEIRKKVDYAAKNIYFNTGSAKLLSKSNKGLNEVVTILKDNPDLKLGIHGHTDNVGKPEKNKTLSENRAAAVKKYLVTKGVDEGRIISAGHGSDEPVADNKSAAGRAKNRRVELKLGY